MIYSSLQAVNMRTRVNDDSSFPWLFGTGTFSQVAGVLITKLFKFKMAPRDFTLCPTGAPSSKYVVYATACVYRELYGKITDRKKDCVIVYSFRRRSNGFRITSLNGVRMALNSAQETSSPHI